MSQQNGGSGTDAGAESARGGAAPEPFDSVVDAHVTLSNGRRRAVLDELVRVDGPLTIGGLAVRLTDRENADETNQRQRTYLSLSRTHVPSLERHGLVEYDQTVGTVSLAVTDDRVDRLRRWWAGREGLPTVEFESSTDSRTR